MSAACWSRLESGAGDTDDSGVAPSPERIRELAAEAGFDLVRFGPLDLGGHADHYLAWLAAGRAGAMEYMVRHRDKIVDPRTLAPAARSTVSLAFDYGGPPVRLQGGGRVARYAAGRDYHRFLGNKTRWLRKELERDGVPWGSVRVGTDAIPLLERALAVRAGIGFLAKSAGVIHPRLGPFLLLSELLTPLDLPHDPPSAGSCGTCTACLDACPTGAIVAPFEVDARRCLSYTTIELRGPIPTELRAPQGEWLFGCDVCLEVCPFAHRGRAAGGPRPADLAWNRGVREYSLVGILEIGEEEFERDWSGTALHRATRSGLRRNAAVVLGNLRDPSAAPALERALGDPDPSVRGHGAWALGRIGGSRTALEIALRNEPEAWVRGELEAALATG